jgi:flagellar hook-length control protein FliK
VLPREAAPQVSQENQDKPELATEDRNILAVLTPDSAQLVMPEASPIANVTIGKQIATKIGNLSQDQAGPEPQNDPASLINMSPDSKLSVVPLPSPSLNATQPLGPISLAAKSENEPFLTSLDQPVAKAVTNKKLSQSEESPILAGQTLRPAKPLCRTQGNIFEIVSNTSSSQVVPDVQQAMGENAEAIPVFNKTLAGKPHLAIGENPAQQNSLLGPPQAILANPEETALAARKPIDNKAAANQKTRIPSESPDSNGKKSVNNLLDDSAPRRLNVAEIQISSQHPKDLANSASGVNPNLQQILSHNNTQPLLAQRSPASAQTGNTANNVSTGDLSAGIREQILQSIHGSLSGSDRQISIRLNPPELGKVFIKFQEHDAQITGLLEVGRTQTRYQIEQALPQIIRDLQDSGVQIKRLEVVLTEQTGQHAHQDQSLPDAWSQQHGSAESGATRSNNSSDLWRTNDGSYQDSLLRQVQITDGSINILV